MALSLPFPSKSDGEDSVGARDIAAAKRLEQRMLNKLLLIGCDHSGTSTIFKQVKVLGSGIFRFRLIKAPICLSLLLKVQISNKIVQRCSMI